MNPNLLSPFYHIISLICSPCNDYYVWISGHAKNPYAVKPSFEHWGPWIGKNTRKSEVVFNTEFDKVSSSKPSAEAEVSLVSEDRLVDELMKQKVFLYV